MCETLSPLEELSLSDARYQCATCSGVEDINEVYHRKINTLIEEEDVLKGIEIEAKIKCDNLKAAFSKVMVVPETQLDDTLEKIKVVCQAYHGNVMVGNYYGLYFKLIKISL